ncbi:AAA family ATPase [Bacillus luteolus]|uniref:AAA family ATPase n=1 Tax=Litchfieldia luteola TaxID=682179 RepID=A0ABR9QM86_9BACI|nr:AAA family ATPase [Cytobacillus luteolus]MBP1941016.1 chloramphenicol 3-O phosphotransferase [Cytobacillus luteolus]
MNKGKIIYLNGVSSSGKTSLSKELIKLLPNYFHFSLDDFDYIIEKMEDRQNERLIPIATEVFYHQTIKMFSDKGVNLIIDDVLHDNVSLKSATETLQDYPVLFVGVQCPLEELERRERERGDRTVGQAKIQLNFVHQNGEMYDVEVNTFNEKLEVCAVRIVEAVNQELFSDGWKTFCKV